MKEAERRVGSNQLSGSKASTGEAKDLLGNFLLRDAARRAAARDGGGGRRAAADVQEVVRRPRAEACQVSRVAAST